MCAIPNVVFLKVRWIFADFTRGNVSRGLRSLHKPQGVGQVLANWPSCVAFPAHGAYRPVQHYEPLCSFGGDKKRREIRLADDLGVTRPGDPV